MESCQDNGQFYGELCLCEAMVFGIISHKAAYGMHERIEKTQHPYHAENIEDQVGEGSPSGLGVGSECRKIGCGRGTDILSHY